MSSTLRMIRITVLCFTMVLVTLGAVSAGTMSEEVTSLTFDLSCDTIFIENTTGDSTKEWAAIVLSICDTSFAGSETLDKIECKFVMDSNWLEFQVAYPCAIWDTVCSDTPCCDSIGCDPTCCDTLTRPTFWTEYNDSARTVYLEFAHGEIAVPDTPTPVATIYFTGQCMYEDRTENLLLVKESGVTNIEVDGTTYYADYDCGSCYDDGSVTVADYEAEILFVDTTVHGVYDDEFTVSVTATTNFRTIWMLQQIEYDTTKLEFLGLADNYDDVYTEGCNFANYYCPWAAQYPINLGITEDSTWFYEGFVVPMDTATTVYSLRFKARTSPLWDGDSAWIAFIPDSSHFFVFKDSGLVSWCGALSQHGIHDWDPDSGWIHMAEYEAGIAAVADSNEIYPLSQDSKVWYTLQMKNNFPAGIPYDDDAFKGNITCNFNLGPANDLAYEGKVDLCDSALYFRVNDDHEALRPPGMSLSPTPHILCLYQDWGDTLSWDNEIPVSLDYTDILQLEFEYQDSFPTPATYADRFLTFDIMSENENFTTGDPTRISTVLLGADTLPLVVCDSASGNLELDADPLEIGIAEFYTTGGTGNLFYRDLEIRHSFDLYDFEITVTIDPYHYIDTVYCEFGVLAERLTCSENSCWRIYADPNMSWSATGDSWRDVANIKYRNGVAVPCGTYRNSYAVFSDQDVKGANDNSRYVLSTDSVLVRTYGGGCQSSCPVLFTHDGDNFIKNNPLLTACEALDYKEVVTDFYHVRTPVGSENGVVRFQLQEMEEETTFLENLTLFTVDHSPTTQVACAVDGSFNTFTDVVYPLSAVDNNGVDQLHLVGDYDNDFYISEEEGFIIVTFPNTPGRGTGYQISAGLKDLCTPRKPGSDDGQLNRLTVETLNSDGIWVKSSIIPPREEHVDEIITCDPEASVGQDIITLRISWTKGYVTDAITQFIASDEQPQVYSYPITDFVVSYADPAGKTWSGFKDSEMLILSRGDVLDFRFEVGHPDNPEMVREYVICAQGRYEPNYSVFADLVPDGFQLYDAYPNPFNPKTTIEYAIPATGEVTLEVFNLLGQMVVTLVEGVQEAGHHKVDWNSTDESGQTVASGVYFYRLTTENFTQSKKMILLK